MDNLGQRVRELRLSKAMKVRQLAHTAGVSASYIYAIESGTRGSHVSKLELIAHALGVPLSVLLGEGGEE
jgi:transcriptional regulator with XRE-family HTH domain